MNHRHCVFVKAKDKVGQLRLPDRVLVAGCIATLRWFFSRRANVFCNSAPSSMDLLNLWTFVFWKRFGTKCSVALNYGLWGDTLCEIRVFNLSTATSYSGKSPVEIFPLLSPKVNIFVLEASLAQKARVFYLLPASFGRRTSWNCCSRIINLHFTAPMLLLGIHMKLMLRYRIAVSITFLFRTLRCSLLSVPSLQWVPRVWFWLDLRKKRLDPVGSF